MFVDSVRNTLALLRSRNRNKAKHSASPNRAPAPVAASQTAPFDAQETIEDAAGLVRRGHATKEGFQRMVTSQKRINNRQKTAGASNARIKIPPLAGIRDPLPRPKYKNAKQKSEQADTQADASVDSLKAENQSLQGAVQDLQAQLENSNPAFAAFNSLLRGTTAFSTASDDDIKLINSIPAGIRMDAFLREFAARETIAKREAFLIGSEALFNSLKRDCGFTGYDLSCYLHMQAALLDDDSRKAFKAAWAPLMDSPVHGINSAWNLPAGVSLPDAVTTLKSKSRSPRHAEATDANANANKSAKAQSTEDRWSRQFDQIHPDGESVDVRDNDKPKSTADAWSANLK